MCVCGHVCVGLLQVCLPTNVNLKKAHATRRVLGSCKLILRFVPGYRGINTAADSFQGKIQQQIAGGPHVRDFHPLVHCPAG